MSKPQVYESGLGGLIASQGGEPDWLSALRRRGQEEFARIGVPTTHTEEWKYTPLREMAGREWVKAEGGPATFPFDLPFVVSGSLRAVVVNGRLDRNQSSLDAPAGLTVKSLRDAWTEMPEKIKDHLGQASAIDRHPFAALNTAIFEDGLLIHIGKNADIEPVLEIVHVAAEDGTVSAPRILLIAEEGCRVRIVERYIGEDETLTLPVTEAFISANAHVTHIRVQDEGAKATHLGQWESRLERDCHYGSANVAYGGLLARLDQNLTLGGENIECRLDGVVVARGRQILDNHTRLDHAVPNCESYEIYKQIIDDQATVVFNGAIYVHPDAQKTDAEQTNQALLLSPDATINSKPQLEIFADDVKCTHGATVGQIEADPLFYMRSRGIPRETANGLLVYAFAAEVLELIEIDELREDLEKRLYEKLGN